MEEIDSSYPEYEIEILVAPPTSGTRDAFDGLVMEKVVKNPDTWTLKEAKMVAQYIGKMAEQLKWVKTTL